VGIWAVTKVHGSRAYYHRSPVVRVCVLIGSVRVCTCVASMAPAAPHGKPRCCLRAGERREEAIPAGRMPFLPQEWHPFLPAVCLTPLHVFVCTRSRACMLVHICVACACAYAHTRINKRVLFNQTYTRTNMHTTCMHVLTKKHTQVHSHR
jgi:hypothetical protein